MRRSFSHANVTATLALFIALGGTSYAATELSAGSVRTGHIRDGQVKRADLGSAAVDSTKIANGTIVLEDLNPRTIAELRGQNGKDGAAGRDGNTGAPGSPAAAVVTHLTSAGGTTSGSTPIDLPDLSGTVLQRAGETVHYVGEVEVTKPATCSGVNGQVVVEVWSGSRLLLAASKIWQGPGTWRLPLVAGDQPFAGSALGYSPAATSDTEHTLTARARSTCIGEDYTIDKISVDALAYR